MRTVWMSAESRHVDVATWYYVSWLCLVHRAVVCFNSVDVPDL